MLPSGSAISTATFGFFFSSGTRSDDGVSHQSTSPFCSAAAAVATSGTICHSIRSKLMRLPPDSQFAFSARGTYPSNFSKIAFAPGTHSFLLNRIGPEPTYSVICLNGSVAAMRSGMMNRLGVLLLPSANSIFG